MKIHTLIVGGAAVLALAFANVTCASISDLSTSLSSNFTSDHNSGGSDNHGGNDNNGGSNDNHSGGCDITPVPEATTFLPVVGLVAAVVASEVLRRRRAASLKR
jgi:hypothetical protein